MVQPFIDLLAAHDPDEVQSLIDRSGLFAAPFRRIQSGSWSLTGWLEPIAPEKRGDGRSRPLVKGPARTEVTDDSTPVRQAILDKASKYGQLNAPLVVAVNVCDPFFDKDDELETLFGKEQIVSISKAALISRRNLVVSRTQSGSGADTNRATNGFPPP